MIFILDFKRKNKKNKNQIWYTKFYSISSPIFYKNTMYNYRDISKKLNLEGRSEEYAYRQVMDTMNGRQGKLSDEEIDGLIDLIQGEHEKMINLLHNLKDSENETRSTATKHNG